MIEKSIKMLDEIMIHLYNITCFSVESAEIKLANLAISSWIRRS